MLKINECPIFSLLSARWKEAGVRLCRGILGEQLHGPRVGQVQRLVPRLQQEGSAQERLADHAEATGSPLHETPAQGQAGPAGGVSFHHSNKADTKGSAVKTQEELTGPDGTALILTTEKVKLLVLKTSLL